MVWDENSEYPNPVGQRESQHLEFKSKDALKHLASVGREVVAMLNSEGGDVWVGLREADGVAVTLEPIKNLDREIGRLRDHFSDSIEPAPGPGEIDFDKIDSLEKGLFYDCESGPSRI
jgi:predicted HTH transcriptional regulator